MDELEITNLEPQATSGRYPWNADIDTKSIASQALPIAGGVVAGVVGGYLICRFVVKPIIAKIKAKKEAVPSEEETKTEE